MKSGGKTTIFFLVTITCITLLTMIVTQPVDRQTDGEVEMRGKGTRWGGDDLGMASTLSWFEGRDKKSVCIPEHPQVQRRNFRDAWKGKDKIGKEVRVKAAPQIRVRVRPALAGRKCEQRSANELTE